MSNAYSFDFLKADHRDTLEGDGRPKQLLLSSSDNNAAAQAQLLLNKNANEDQLQALRAQVSHKPDLEKQFDVLAFLQAHRSAGCLAPDVIYRATGIDLEDADASVAKLLEKNPKIRTERLPDPENPQLLIAAYAYQAKYNHVRNKKTLLAQINRCKNGVPLKDLLDCYEGVQDDLASLITAGDVLALYNSEDKDKILFPRGEAFLVELDGIITVPPQLQTTARKPSVAVDESGTDNAGSNNAMISTSTDQGGIVKKEDIKATPVYLVDTDVDPKKQIRRGEAIQVGGQWFRISSAVKEGVPLSEQPVRAQAPLSVVSLMELSKRNEQDGYIRPFGASKIPLDAALTDEALQNLKSAKEAREKLHKLAHNINGARSGMSTAAQLLSSNAHASNPATLAQSFAMANTTAGATAAGSGTIRKRPTKTNYSQDSNLSSNNPNQPNTTATAKQNKQQAVQAQQAAAMDPALGLYSHARRHGCTKDVRNMYLSFSSAIPESDAELQALLVKHQLLESDELLRRPRLSKRGTNTDNDGKPKKRRYYERKNQRMTNTHLEGTEIGAVLRRAQEVQAQGKSVGDGGM